MKKRILGAIAVLALGVVGCGADTDWKNCQNDKYFKAFEKEWKPQYQGVSSYSNFAEAKNLFEVYHWNKNDEIAKESEAVLCIGTETKKSGKTQEFKYRIYKLKNGEIYVSANNLADIDTLEDLKNKTYKVE